MKNAKQKHCTAIGHDLLLQCFWKATKKLLRGASRNRYLKYWTVRNFLTSTTWFITPTIKSRWELVYCRGNTATSTLVCGYLTWKSPVFVSSRQQNLNNHESERQNKFHTGIKQKTQIKTRHNSLLHFKKGPALLTFPCWMIRCRVTLVWGSSHVECHQGHLVKQQVVFNF